MQRSFHETRREIQLAALSEANKAGRKRKLDDAPVEEIATPVSNEFEKFEGRRLVEMDELAENLWCHACDIPISLRHFIDEKVQGVASRMTIKCYRCNNLVRVNTSKRSDGVYYDSNLKLGIAMLDSGQGESRVNTFISEMNMPAVHVNSLKRYERRVGQKMEELANQSCLNAIEREKLLTRKQRLEEANVDGADFNNNEDVEIEDLEASQDAAWPKRGRQNNSMSGHASLIGVQAGQILAWECCETYCRKCKEGRDKNDHNCKGNHSGSAKSMEAAMAVNMILRNGNFVKLKCRVKTVIGDDDSSAIACLKKLSPYVIEKLSDFNHVKKTFNTKLYDLKLIATLIKYFSRVFAMNIKKNKGDAFKVKIALDSMIPHAFGDHSKCDSSCVRDEEGVHVFKYFKDGECLTDKNLKNKLEKIIQPYVNSSAQIAPCASSQANESFNHTITSKHHKDKFYGGSESHSYRVASAVCQKNMGYTYVVFLNVMLQLSPGKHTENFRKRKQERFESQAEKHLSTEGKKRRVILKNQRSSKNTANLNKEGTSYQSGSGYLDTSDLIDEVIIADLTDYEDSVIVVYDIETTGLYLVDEIVQVAVVCGEERFNAYILPYKNFSPEAAEVTKMKKVDGKLYVGDKQVATVSAREAFVQFLYFLKMLEKPCILVAHNGFRFDAPRIIRMAKQLALTNELKLFVKGFSDSVYFFKDHLTERREKKLSFAQVDLVKEYLSGEDVENAHNALNDVMMLQNLMAKFQIDKLSILLHTKSLNFMIDPKYADPHAINCTESLHDVKISRDMKIRLSRAGFSRTKLEDASRKGKEAFHMLMSQSVCGKPRVTKNKKTIDTLFDALMNVKSD